MNLVLKGKIVERYGSQWRFAQSLGVHEHQISQVVRGRRVLSPEDRKRWAEKLGEDEGRLFHPEEA